MPLIYLSCAWVAGIYLGPRFNPSLVFALVGLIPLPLLLVHKHRKIIILTSLCIITLFTGTFCYQASLTHNDESSLHFYNNCRTVKVRGMVDRDPEVGEKTTHLYLSATEIKWGDKWQEISGSALLFVPLLPAYDYGNVLEVTGKLETPPQLGEFDYKCYLAHQGIYSTMLYPEIKIMGSGKGFKPLELVYSLRNRLSQALAKVLPEPQASLGQGIVLGIRSNIPSSLKDAFSRTGTAHILAISGVNLSIVAGMLLSIGIWLFGRRRYTYIWLTLGIIWFYALLTGMHPPVVRAAIMASLFLIAEFLGRQRSAITSLAFAGAIMVGISPQILWDASFQLSFLAMAGLIFLFPPLQTLGRKAVNATLGESGVAARIAKVIADSFGVTLAAIIASWPVIAYYFGIISFVGPLATLLALPALPGITITGALAGGLGLVFLPAAQVIAWLAWLFLSYMLLVVNGFAAIPVASHKVDSIDTHLLWAYYLSLAFVLWLISPRQQARTMSMVKSGMNRITSFFSGLPRRWVVPPLLVAAILASVTAATMPDDNLHVSFLDVGQGDAILIQRGSQEILIDGGPSPQAVCLGLGEKLPFWDRTIELLVLTHPHADHLTGLLEVLQRYKVNQVLYPALDYNSPIYGEWLKLIREKAVKCTIAQAGQQIDLGDGVVINVLNPQTPHITGTEPDLDTAIENNGSMVLRLSLGRVSFLLTADIMQEAEFKLMADRADLSSTVLKVAHHGSNTSTTPQFLAVVNPQAAVVSVGADNKFGHPKKEVVDRLEGKKGLEKIYCTDECGTIEFTTDGERLWVRVGR